MVQSTMGNVIFPEDKAGTTTYKLTISSERTVSTSLKSSVTTPTCVPVTISAEGKVRRSTTKQRVANGKKQQCQNKYR